MKKLSVSLFVACSLSLCVGQSDPPEASKKSQAYHEYRLKETPPPYELTKVKALIAGMKQKGQDRDEGTTGLSSRKFGSLSVPAKFTYCMIYGENYSQNCDAMPAVL